MFIRDNSLDFAVPEIQQEKNIKMDWKSGSKEVFDKIGL